MELLDHRLRACLNCQTISIVAVPVLKILAAEENPVAPQSAIFTNSHSIKCAVVSHHGLFAFP